MKLVQKYPNIQNDIVGDRKMIHLRRPTCQFFLTLQLNNNNYGSFFAFIKSNTFSFVYYQAIFDPDRHYTSEFLQPDQRSEWILCVRHRENVVPKMS